MPEHVTAPEPTGNPAPPDPAKNPAPAPRAKPAAASPWPRRLLWLGLGVAVLGAAGYGALTIGLNRYLQSNGLRESVGQQTAAELRASAGYLPVTARGLTLFSDGLAARGEPSAPLRDLRARGLEARCRLRGLWHGVWEIEELRVERLQAAYGDAAAAKYIEPDLPAQPALQPPVDTPSTIRVDIRQTRIARADLSWGQTEQDLGYILGVKTLCTLTGPDGKELAVQGDGGRLRQAGFPELAISRLRLHYAKPELRIEQGDLRQPEKDGGEVTTRGKIRFEGATPLEISMSFNRCTVAPFLPPDWREKFSGRFGGETTVQKDLNNEEPVAARGDLKLTDGVLQELAALDKIATLTRHARFRRLPLHVVRAKFSYEQGTLKVTDFRAESEGLVCVEGSFTISKKRIRGRFQLGVAPDVAESIPGAKESVFTKAHDGYVWTPVRLRGPLDRPRDDLKPRLVKAAEAQIAKSLLAPLVGPGKEILELLRRF